MPGYAVGTVVLWIGHTHWDNVEVLRKIAMPTPEDYRRLEDILRASPNADLYLLTLARGDLRFRSASENGAVWGDDEGYTITLRSGGKWRITDKAGQTYDGRGALELELIAD
jgi:hypothetical protein